MKKFLISVFAIAAVTSCFILMGHSGKKNAHTPLVKRQVKNGFVVMELFTSQGCSSCPPADELLGNYTRQNEENIFTLSFHVDYWNRLGWIDSFSNKKYTQRQNEYALKYNLASIYTPQLIINGQKECVGSDEEKISGFVASAKNEFSSIDIKIVSTAINGNRMDIGYVVNDLIPNTNVNAVLVQDKAVTQIRAGENQGLQMTSYNIVRDLVTTSLKNTRGNCSVQLPPGYSSAGYHIVLFVQNIDSGKILAAVRSV